MFRKNSKFVCDYLFCYEFITTSFRYFIEVDLEYARTSITSNVMQFQVARLLSGICLCIWLVSVVKFWMIKKRSELNHYNYNMYNCCMLICLWEPKSLSTRLTGLKILYFTAKWNQIVKIWLWKVLCEDVTMPRT